LSLGYGISVHVCFVHYIGIFIQVVDLDLLANDKTKKMHFRLYLNMTIMIVFMNVGVGLSVIRGELITAVAK